MKRYNITGQNSRKPHTGYGKSQKRNRGFAGPVAHPERKAWHKDQAVEHEAVKAAWESKIVKFARA